MPVPPLPIIAVHSWFGSSSLLISSRHRNMARCSSHIHMNTTPAMPTRHLEHEDECEDDMPATPKSIEIGLM